MKSRFFEANRRRPRSKSASTKQVGIPPQALGPFDDHDRIFIGHNFIEVDSVSCRCAFVETIEIDVIKQKPATVRVD